MFKIKLLQYYCDSGWIARILRTLEIYIKSKWFCSSITAHSDWFNSKSILLKFLKSNCCSTTASSVGPRSTVDPEENSTNLSSKRELTGWFFLQLYLYLYLHLCLCLYLYLHLYLYLYFVLKLSISRPRAVPFRWC